MDGALMVMGVGLGITSMAFILIFMLLRNVEVNRERLEKIFGKEITRQLEEAKDDKEIEAIIRALPRRKKTKLKTLLESQDIRDAIEAVKNYIWRKEKNGKI
ncbi:MAG: 4-hydroxy-3-methylbut-2-en-1-yl diphosphate synthase [Epsilonproteobacteria bacterium]|jgi:uncharacterized membrane protein|nr:4-hydroxy-3-methylbut-2-en-1-yl diphosphate synthase [Campylobacterota bacterium]NPA88898.1 4-hydroxy-3-methylbut-2-en-1-yl diphosphate synthase [Campylobacterota bacterium]